MRNRRAVRFSEIRSELEATRAPGDIARLLNRRLGFTQNDLSAATGAHWRTVGGWLGRGEQAPGNNEHKQKLQQLRALVDLILEDGTIAAHMADWFRAPNRNLGYETPFELIAGGRWKEVGGSLCEEIGIPKAVWPKAFQPDPHSGRQKRRPRQPIDS